MRRRSRLLSHKRFRYRNSARYSTKSQRVTPAGRSYFKSRPSLMLRKRSDIGMRNPTIAGLFIARVLATLALIALASRAEAAERVVSKYTSTARAKSLSFKDESNLQEGGFEAVFAGFGGYKLVHLAGDERSWINIRFGKNTVDLYSATMEAGGGNFSQKANDGVGWRGTEKKGSFVSYAIIYRIAAGQGQSPE